MLIKRVVGFAVFVLVSITAGPLATASFFLPLTADQQVRMTSAIFRGTVVNVQAYVDPADGFIYTRTVFRVEETFKGKLPPFVRLVHRGGTVGNRGMMDGFAPQFKPGEQRLIFVSRRPNGTLFATRGDASAWQLPPVGSDSSNPAFAPGASLLTELRGRISGGVLAGSDLTDQAASLDEQALQPSPSGPVPLSSPSSLATNLMTDTSGIPARFVQPDRGEGIPYWIDADYLPAGMTLAQALNAVQAALAAWTNVTSLKYNFAGMRSFGMAVGNMTNNDGSLLIQLHDHYHSIVNGGGGDTLGLGGHSWFTSTSPSGWTTGGNVAGNDFHKVGLGTVVLQHTNTFMQNTNNFAEVLCHEIGHTIGLGHSSQLSPEPNSLLAQAIMYYLAHGNGRGATLQTWDINIVRQVHPPANTPPWCYDRVMDVVTCPGTFTTPGVNTIRVPGYDLQNSTLTLTIADQSFRNGTFSATTSNVTFTPSGWYNDSGRFDPVGNTFPDLVYARYSDGVNASPFCMIKVVSLWSDPYNEGVPGAWRQAFFGNANPSVGQKHHATDDPDGDGFSNVVEWWLGSSPTNGNSNLRLTMVSPTNIQWQAKGYEVYELYGSTNLSTWTRVINPIVPTNFVPGTNLFNLSNSIGSATGFTNGGPRQFFRIYKVP